MPPKAKFTKEDIAAAAFDLAREKGIGTVTVRSVAERLNTSTSPVFTAFSGIDELRESVTMKAAETYAAFSGSQDEKVPGVLRFSLSMAGFAKTEPKLFSLLFAPSEGRGQLFGYEDAKKQFCASARSDYGLSEEDSEFFFSQLWIYSFGLSSLIASGAVKKTPAELNTLLSDEFKAQYVLIKSGKR